MLVLGDPFEKPEAEEQGSGQLQWHLPTTYSQRAARFNPSQGEPAGSPLRPGCVPSSLGEALTADFHTAPALCWALQPRPHTRSGLIPIRPAGVTPPGAGNLLAWPVCWFCAAIHQCWPEGSLIAGPAAVGSCCWHQQSDVKTLHRYLCQGAEVVQPFSGMDHGELSLSGSSKWKVELQATHWPGSTCSHQPWPEPGQTCCHVWVPAGRSQGVFSSWQTL